MRQPMPTPSRGLLNTLLALSAPLLLLVALAVLVQRRGPDRIQAVPALVIGGVLLGTSLHSRRRRRRRLLAALRSGTPSGRLEP
ncbi:conserved protein of unknown function [Cyanobium sp. NIES-981]|nr:conserved protein of unknown function [Cyanobium sp. NIES-981]